MRSASIFLLCAFCIAFIGVPAPAEDAENQMETVEPCGNKAGKAIVYIYRMPRFAGGAIDYSFYVDRVLIGEMRSGNYVRLELAPGVHSFAGDEVNVATKIEMEAGREYYFNIHSGGTHNHFVTTCDISYMPPEMGKYEFATIKKPTRIKEKNLENEAAGEIIVYEECATTTVIPWGEDPEGIVFRVPFKNGETPIKKTIGNLNFSSISVKIKESRGRPVKMKLGVKAINTGYTDFYGIAYIKLQDKDGETLLQQVLYEDVEEEEKAKYIYCTIDLSDVEANRIESIAVKLWAKWKCFNAEPDE